jgi:hypothetical protein
MFRLRFPDPKNKHTEIPLNAFYRQFYEHDEVEVFTTIPSLHKCYAYAYINNTVENSLGNTLYISKTMPYYVGKLLSKNKIPHTNGYLLNFENSSLEYDPSEKSIGFREVSCVNYEKDHMVQDLESKNNTKLLRMGSLRDHAFKSLTSGDLGYYNTELKPYFYSNARRPSPKSRSIPRGGRKRRQTRRK